MNALRDSAAESEHRLSQAQRLRVLFAGNQYSWFTNADLQRLMGGQRFGARILELRRGEDGGLPMVIERERGNGSGSQWRYRCIGFLPKPAPAQTRAGLIAELRREVQLAHEALQRAQAELEQERAKKVYRAPEVQSFYGGGR